MEPTKTSINARNRNGEQTAFPDALGAGGLSKREYFAGQALQGILSAMLSKNVSPAAVMQDAVTTADALLQELEK